MRERDQRFIVDGEGSLAKPALGVFERTAQQLDDVRHIERAQHVDASARQQRADDFEGRILGGRADERQRAVFDVRQEGVLLRLVEAMHFVEEQHGAAPAFGAHGARTFDGFADVLDAGHDRRELHEFRVGAACDQPRERGLARARRPPEDQRMQLTAFERLAQRLARAEHLFLADEFIERARPHAIGQRPQSIVGIRFAQEVGLSTGTSGCAARGHCAVRRPNNQAANSGQRASPTQRQQQPEHGAEGIRDHVTRVAIAADMHVVLRKLDRDAEQQQERRRSSTSRAAARGRRNTAPARRGRSGGSPCR